MIVLVVWVIDQMLYQKGGIIFAYDKLEIVFLEDLCLKLLLCLS